MPRVVARLLQLGANPLDEIDMGSNALHVAAYYSNEECVKALLENSPLEAKKTMVR